MTPTQTQPNLSLATGTQFELLRESLTDFVNSLANLSAICETPDDQERINQYVVEGNKFIKLVEEERLKITREIDKQKQQWIDLQKSLTSPVETALAPFKQSVHAYNVERVRKIKEAEALARETEAKLIAQNGQVDWLVAKPKPDRTPKGVQLRWTFELLDLAKVPLMYLTLDESAIRDAIKSGKKDIPGIRIYQQPVTTYRA